MTGHEQFAELASTYREVLIGAVAAVGLFTLVWARSWAYAVSGFAAGAVVVVWLVAGVEWPIGMAVVAGVLATAVVHVLAALVGLR